MYWAQKGFFSFGSNVHSFLLIFIMFFQSAQISFAKTKALDKHFFGNVSVRYLQGVQTTYIFLLRNKKRKQFEYTEA